jgi:hypothetical protein
MTVRLVSLRRWVALRVVVRRHGRGRGVVVHGENVFRIWLTTGERAVGAKSQGKAVVAGGPTARKLGWRAVWNTAAG